jgi:hypothetical protein
MVRGGFMMKWKVIAALGVVFGIAGIGWGVSAQRSSDQVFELRMYEAMPGKRDALSERFHEHTMAMFEKAGMTNVGYWTASPGDASDDLFIYMLSYSSREARDETWARLAEDPDFQREIIAEERSEELKLVSTIDARILVPTSYSPLK